MIFALAGDVGDPDISRDFGACDWTRLLQAAAQENAVIALHNAVKQARHDGVPLGVARQIACLALQAELRMRRLERRLEQVLAALCEVGIHVTLLKGAALAPTLYGSFVARPMHDLDLLVDKDRALEAREVIRALGWTRDPSVPGDDAYAGHHHLPPLLDSSGSGLRLEIHTEIIPRDNPFALRTPDLLGDAREVSVGAARASVLSTTHHAVYATIHFAWSHELHLGAWHAIRDLGTLARRGFLDWSAFVKTAKSWRAETCAYWTLRLGRSLAALPVPDDVLRELEPRLPDFLLAFLERHFTQSALRSANVCPSVRLNRELWSVAIQPRRSGHGDIRPWLASSALIEERRRLEPRPPTARGALARLGSIRRWSGYLARIV